MNTKIDQLEQKLRDLEKILLFETDRKAVGWYIVAYVETYCEIELLLIEMSYQLN